MYSIHVTTDLLLFVATTKQQETRRNKNCKVFILSQQRPLLQCEEEDAVYEKSEYVLKSFTMRCDAHNVMDKIQMPRLNDPIIVLLHRTVIVQRCRASSSSSSLLFDETRTSLNTSSFLLCPKDFFFAVVDGRCRLLHHIE